MSAELIVLNRDKLEIAATPDAWAVVEAALAESALIGRVTTPAEQETAFAAQAKLATTLRAIEAERKKRGAPLVEVKRQLDAVAKELSADLLGEEARVGRLVDGFQAKERERVRALEEQRLAEINRLRQEAAEKAMAGQAEAARAAAEQVQEKLREAPARPAKAEGQVTGEDWDIEITDKHALYMAHPTCFRLDPLMGEIKMRLNAGLALPGVTARKVVKSTFRGKTPLVIDSSATERRIGDG